MRWRRRSPFTPIDIAEATLAATLDVLVDLGLLDLGSADRGLLGNAIAAAMCDRLGIDAWEEL